MTVELHGYSYSVYVRIARLALEEKGVVYTRVEVDPFAEQVPARYLAMHPFRRVPTLVHDGFVLYETAAITCYVDEAFAGPALRPDGAKSRARMRQIISVIDSYGYWPMVRQVFSHCVWRPRLGSAANSDEIRAGLQASARVLFALDALASDGRYLVDDGISLADIHLAPMVAYLTAASEGRVLLSDYPRLSAWWRHMAHRRAVVDTDPGLPAPKP
jgi:glutathione S-transferase